MKNLTGGSYFSGGEGVGIAMRQAGIEHLFGVEFDKQISEAAERNGFTSITSDVCEIDPELLPHVNIFHASPVCHNASSVKHNGTESDADIQTALATCRYIECHKPEIFTLENVWGYRDFEAFKLIIESLVSTGYCYDYWRLNASDYGVPQNRHRLILIASLTHFPKKPVPTHTSELIPMFETLLPYENWEGCLTNESLKEWTPTPRVKDLYWENMPELALINSKDTNFDSRANIVVPSGNPSFTITANHGPTGIIIYKDRISYRSTARIQARLQSFPDTYILPERPSLACKIIGNSVPPKLYEAVLHSILKGA